MSTLVNGPLHSFRAREERAGEGTRRVMEDQNKGIGRWTAVGALATAIATVVAVVALFKSASNPSPAAAPATTIMVPYTPQPSIPPTQAPGEYVLLVPLQELRLTFPKAPLCSTSVDLDAPEISFDSDHQRFDLRYVRCGDSYEKLSLGYGTYGNAKGVEPSSADHCLRSLQFATFPRRDLFYFELDLGDAWCIVTPAGNLVWIRLKDNPNSGDDLVWDYMRWSPRSRS